MRLEFYLSFHLCNMVQLKKAICLLLLLSYSSISLLNKYLQFCHRILMHAECQSSENKIVEPKNKIWSRYRRLCAGGKKLRVYIQFMSPIGVKRWQIRPIQLTTIIASHGFVYDCSSLILANTLFMNALLL